MSFAPPAGTDTSIPSSPVRRYILGDEQALNLSGKCVGDEEAKALGEELATNATLTPLDLGCNIIGDDGTAALANALLINTTLKELNLSRNRIGDEGAVAFGAALALDETGFGAKHNWRRRDGGFGKSLNEE
jgi:Leucine Rich repeat